MNDDDSKKEYVTEIIDDIEEFATQTSIILPEETTKMKSIYSEEPLLESIYPEETSSFSAENEFAKHRKLRSRVQKKNRTTLTEDFTYDDTFPHRGLVITSPKLIDKLSYDHIYPRRGLRSKRVDYIPENTQNDELSYDDIYPRRGLRNNISYPSHDATPRRRATKLEQEDFIPRKRVGGKKRTRKTSRKNRKTLRNKRKLPRKW